MAYKAEFIWLEDGSPVTGGRVAFENALRSDLAVKGLWRIAVLTEDGDDVMPVIVPDN